MGDTCGITITKRVDSDTEAMVFNARDEYIIFKFDGLPKGLIVVYICKPGGGDYFTIPVEPDFLSNVYANTKIYYAKFGLCQLLNRQNDKIDKWRVEFHERRGQGFVKLRERFIIVNKTPLPF